MIVVEKSGYDESFVLGNLSIFEHPLFHYKNTGIVDVYD
jgi:hypothetical protein